MLITKEIKNFTYGIVTSLEPTSIPVGSFSRALNFLTKGDKVELRRGYRTIGTTIVGTGSVAGLAVGTKLDSSGTQVLFRKRKGQRTIEYYDTATEDWIETGSNITPAVANDDDFAFDTYQSQAGSMIFGSSPNSSIYKILVANPGSITDLLSTVYKGYIRVKQARMFLWNRKDSAGRSDEQNPYLSYIDGQNYTTVSAESIGVSGSLTYTGTLAFKGAGVKRTCFGITFTDGVETFTDDRDGTLTGSAGGTGTINYTTGAYSITFNAVAAGSVTSTYLWEDSTSEGLADFSFSSPTRTAGQGNVFLQGDGGPLMGIETYGDIEYCGHKYKTYSLKNTIDDTDAQNIIFRDREGIPNWRAIKGTSKGIFFVNALDTEDPKLKLLTLESGSTAVDGKVISQNLDLSEYRFDKCEVNEFLDFVSFACRTEDSAVNNRYILYHKEWESFDIVDYWGLVTTVYDGAVHIGESVSQNVVEAFSGIDDDGTAIHGFFELNEWDLDYPGYLKKVKKLQIEGEIGPDQVFDVKVAIDKGAFVTVGQIKGSGTYVDRSQSVNVGAYTLGRGTIGGGSDVASGITAFHYFREISLPIGKFERIKIKLERGVDADNDNADGIGYFSTSTVRFYDIRLKNRKLPSQYRS